MFVLKKKRHPLIEIGTGASKSIPDLNVKNRSTLSHYFKEFICKTSEPTIHCLLAVTSFQSNVNLYSTTIRMFDSYSQNEAGSNASSVGLKAKLEKDCGSSCSACVCSNDKVPANVTPESRPGKI